MITKLILTIILPRINGHSNRSDIGVIVMCWSFWLTAQMPAHHAE